MTWCWKWSKMVENGGDGKSTRSLVHSLQEWDAVPGSGLATGLSNTQERSQKSCFLIYDTILRKMKIMNEKSLRSHVLRTRSLRSNFNINIKISKRCRQVGVGSLPLRSVVGPQNSYKYIKLQMAVTLHVLVRI